MGMFDSILVACPACNSPLEFQSKSGDCMLNSYSLWSAPAEVVAGAREETCEGCGRKWKLVLPPVNAIIREVLPDRPDEDEV